MKRLTDCCICQTQHTRLTVAVSRWGGPPRSARWLRRQSKSAARKCSETSPPRLNVRRIRQDFVVASACTLYRAGISPTHAASRNTAPTHPAADAYSKHSKCEQAGAEQEDRRRFGQVDVRPNQVQRLRRRNEQYELKIARLRYHLTAILEEIRIEYARVWNGDISRIEVGRE